MCMRPMVLELTRLLQKRGPAAAIVLTDEEVATLGGGKIPPVILTIGTTSVPLRVGRMGGEDLIGFAKAVRTELGVQAGDELNVQIVLDTDRTRNAEPRTTIRPSTYPGDSVSIATGGRSSATRSAASDRCEGKSSGRRTRCSPLVRAGRSSSGDWVISCRVHCRDKKRLRSRT